MGELTHKRLVEGACQWLHQVHHCDPVLPEANTLGTRGEIPDVIGFEVNRSYTARSILVECKATRADFLADLKKPSRSLGYTCFAMGYMRWYFTVPGVIDLDSWELPDRWGCALWDGGPIHGVQIAKHPSHQDFYSRDNEITLLVQTIRRGQAKKGSKWKTRRFRPEETAPIAKVRPCRRYPFCMGCGFCCPGLSTQELTEVRERNTKLAEEGTGT